MPSLGSISLQLYQQHTPAQKLYFEFSDIFKKTYFAEILQTAAFATAIVF